MSSNLKVNNILPSTGDTVAVSGIASVTSSVSIASSCTATTFYGSGANLTSLPAQASITGNADNRVITGGSGVNLNGESNLTFDGTTLSATGQLNLAGGIVLQPGGTAWSTTLTRPQIQRQADGELRLGAGSDSSSIVTFYTSSSAGGTLAERLRIDSSGHLHTGYTSNFGGDHVNILATDGGGISIAQNNSGDATSGTVLGTLSFQGYHSGGATFSSAEAKISGVAAANHTGSSAATDMVFYTKPSTVGPGSAPSERFRITANGNLNWRNGTVRQRKYGAFLGINSAGTSDIKISGNFENNDMLRVRWAYNWNAGDGGAWGEAVIWKQYEGTKRVRYLTDVKASPLTSVSFPHSGNDIWLRWQTNAGINGWYMIDVECHGCDPFPF